MNKEKSTSSVNKPQEAFIILFCIIACINFISMACDYEKFAETGSFRVVLMSVLTVVSIILTLAVFVLYFFKMSHMRSGYFVVSLCCLSICGAIIFRGFPYLQDIKGGTSVVVTNDYWYYMGSEDIAFTDLSGNEQVVSANHIGETTLPLIVSQFFSAASDDSENNKKSIYIEYYPHSRTVVDIHMIK